MRFFFFKKIFLIFILYLVPSNAALWSLSYYSLIESTIKSDVESKMETQMQEVEDLHKYYKDEIKKRNTDIKENKTRLNTLDAEIVLIMKKIELNENKLRKLVL